MAAKTKDGGNSLAARIQALTGFKYRRVLTTDEIYRAMSTADKDDIRRSLNDLCNKDMIFKRGENCWSMSRKSDEAVEVMTKLWKAPQLPDPALYLNTNPFPPRIEVHHVLLDSSDSRHNWPNTASEADSAHPKGATSGGTKIVRWEL